MEVKEIVKEKYGEAARRVTSGGSNGCCGASSALDSCCDPITSNLYDEAQAGEIPEAALKASLGCGNPTALAKLNPGETVLDLGSGGGIDVLLSARRVGPTGKAYGLDMTDDMLALARENQRKAGVENVQFLKGEIEHIPLPDNSVDVIISNCVINLSGDKDQVLREAFRVLKPGGRFAVSDVVTKGVVPDEVRKSMLLWVGCIAGALQDEEYKAKLAAVGFAAIEIEPTRVYDVEDARAFLAGEGIDVDAIAPQVENKFMSAFIRATKPNGCEPQDVTAKRDGLDALKQVEAFQVIAAEFGPLASYLATAEAALPSDHPWIKKVQAVRHELLSDMLDAGKRESPSFRQKGFNKLSGLKRDYSDLYVAAHGRARLGAKDDKLKSQLSKDTRLGQLQRLSTIELMPRQQLSDYQNRLGGLRTCFALTQPDLDASPVCQHCNFRLVSEPDSLPAGQAIRKLEDELDRLHEGWTKTLLNNLEDPTTQQNLVLLKPPTRKIVDAFLSGRTLPDDVNNDFVAALQEALSGLSKVVITTETLRGALLAAGSPATVPELKKRFEDYLVQISKGKDPTKIRVVLE